MFFSSTTAAAFFAPLLLEEFELLELPHAANRVAMAMTAKARNGRIA
jgi:hypothetical protein